MSRSLQRFSALLGAIALIFVQVAPAAAMGEEIEDRGDVNLIFDAAILRPLGLMATAMGAMLFAIPVGPMVALTRPHEIGKPLDYLIMRPARYTFRDPLGHH